MKRLVALAVAAVAAAACAGFAGGEPAGGQEASSADPPLVCDKIFLTQYEGTTAREAALPYAPLEDDGRSVRIGRGDRTVAVRVKETGPWNANDAYWRPESQREWQGLNRCVPQARAAFLNGYNGGKDQFGREVTNPAGIDVTPAVARELGLDRNQNAYVSVEFLWVRP